MNNIENLYFDNDFDKFLIERIFEQQQNILQALLSIKYISSIESLIRINDNRKNKNIRSCFSDRISKLITATVNIPSIILSEDDIDLN